MISLSHASARPDPDAIGNVSTTATVQDWINQDQELFNEILDNVMRYLGGDWGELDSEDWSSNMATINREVPHGRLMGSYSLSNGEKMWVITDGYGRQKEGPDCCYTTVLSPEDY